MRLLKRLWSYSEKQIRSLLNLLLTLWLKRLSLKQLETLLNELLSKRADALSPEEALRFLFRIETELYSLEGKKAIEYGGGVHTKHRHLRYHEFFIKRVYPGEQVLDIGCGIGILAYEVAEKAGAYVTGIDLNPKNIAYALKHYQHPRCTFLKGDALKELPDRAFEVVILSNVLEHLSERAFFLKRIQELLKPSRILIRVPLFERDWRVPLRQELGVEWRLDPTHETEYTSESFQEEMTQAKLKITYQEIRWGEIWAEVVPDGS